MPRSEADLRSIHQYSAHHREMMGRSERAGCFYCLAEFEPTDITEWVDWPDHVGDGQENELGVTAVCPRCGIDSVLPSAAPITWDSTLLAEMHECWFSDHRIKRRGAG